MTLRPSKLAGIALSLLLALAPASAAEADRQNIRLGTILPAGTSGHQCLMEMSDAWHNTSRQAVKVTIFDGAKMGGEKSVVQKMRSGQLDASVLSVVGLSEIDRSVACLQVMPMMFRTWEEVDYVREKIRLELERRLLEKGFVVLFWADAGWVRYFSKSPGASPDDFKKMKMFVWAGDPQQMDIMRGLGYQPVGLETADIYTGLSTGLINAVPLPAFMAGAIHIDKLTGHMLEVNWVPIVGAGVIRRETWNKLSPAMQRQFLKFSQEAGEKIRKHARAEDEAACEVMVKNGLKVQKATPELEAEWRTLAARAYPKIRGPMVPEQLFDQVQQHLNEFRAHTKPSTP